MKSLKVEDEEKGIPYDTIFSKKVEDTVYKNGLKNTNSCFYK